MGGMSSLSFDTTFPQDAAERSEGVPCLPSAGKSQRFSAQSTEEEYAGNWSPWVLSGARRGLDLAVALTALVIFLPLMGLAAIMVRWGSPGPVFFRQKRMGRSGREFILYKFRSMCPVKGNNSSITVTGDARITPIGALLRRYKLDELPQFWNVLRGDMSLVGPRPKLPHHEALHMECRPGITGAATLAFRREEEFLSGIPRDRLEAFYEMFVKPAKAQLDLDYMRGATLRTDLRILWNTASACLLSTDDSVTKSAQTIADYEATWVMAATRTKAAPVPRVPTVPAPAAYSGLNQEA